MSNMGFMGHVHKIWDRRAQLLKKIVFMGLHLGILHQTQKYVPVRTCTVNCRNSPIGLVHNEIALVYVVLLTLSLAGQNLGTQDAAVINTWVVKENWLNMLAGKVIVAFQCSYFALMCTVQRSARNTQRNMQKTTAATTTNFRPAKH